MIGQTNHRQFAAAPALPKPAARVFEDGYWISSDPSIKPPCDVFTAQQVVAYAAQTDPSRALLRRVWAEAQAHQRDCPQSVFSQALEDEVAAHLQSPREPAALPSNNDGLTKPA